MSVYGLKSKGGIVTPAPTEEKAREWAGYDFKQRIGACGERLVKAVDGDWEELEEAA